MRQSGSKWEKKKKKRWLGWLLICMGLLCLPHVVVFQLLIGIYWLNEGSKILWGGLPLPIAVKVSPETPKDEV